MLLCPLKDFKTMAGCSQQSMESSALLQVKLWHWGSNKKLCYWPFYTYPSEARESSRHALDLFQLLHPWPQGFSSKNMERKGNPKVCLISVLRLIPSQHSEEQDHRFSLGQMVCYCQRPPVGNPENINTVSNSSILSPVTLSQSYNSGGGEGKMVIPKSV